MAPFREIRRGLTAPEKVCVEVRTVLVHSDWGREGMRRLYGIQARMLHGALAHGESRATNRAAAHRAVGMDGRGPLIFTVARLMDAKRIDVVIRAFAGLVRERPGARLAIGRTCPDEERLRAVARTEEVHEAVRFLGRIPKAELSRWNESADVFASLKGADFNLTPFEALEAGTPLLVSIETDLGAELPRTGWMESVAAWE